MPFWTYVYVIVTVAVCGFGLGYVVREGLESEALHAYTRQWLDPLPCENGPGHCSVDLDRLRGAR